MSRLHLVFIFCISFSIFGNTQQKLKKIIAFADEQYGKRDYYYALKYYKQALEKDSNSIKLLWKYAETLRAYKDYSEAETYYAKVYAREQTKIFPNSLLNLALMQKQNGRYKQALNTFKLSAKKLEKHKNIAFYNKSLREIESCSWAIENLLDSSEFTPLIHLPETVNTYDAEFGHTIQDNRLIFSALKADSSNNGEEVYDPAYRTKLYYSERNDIGEFQKSEINTDLFHTNLNYGNGSFSLDGSKYYFSICEDEDFKYTCKIVVAQKNDSTWFITDTLGFQVNEKGANTTMPFYTRIDEKEVLLFSSNRKGGNGGMDLWYAESIDGLNFKDAINIRVLNSVENEVTPFYDTTRNALFFSSTWHNGFGGYDVNFSNYVEGLFSNPINLGMPINSPANDLYYFSHHDSIYISSNKKGGYYSKNPTCCSDIYAAYPIIELIAEEDSEDKVVLKDKIETLLPITLYFKNDEPDARTLKTTTKKTYLQTYDEYVKNYTFYKTELIKNLSTEKAEHYLNDLTDFFENQVDFGAVMLDTLKSFLRKELESGAKIELGIKGYASPIAKTAYNVNLTQRRIFSLINYFKSVDNEVFKPYIDNIQPKLSFVYLPFGEYAADQNISDDPLTKSESVFSKAAGIERRIQIEHIKIDRDQSTLPIQSDILLRNLGYKERGVILSNSFSIKNWSSEKIVITLPKNTAVKKISSEKIELLPNEKTDITLIFDTKGLNGHQSIPFTVSVKGYSGTLTFYTNFELK
tara:strand:- start:2322 stop:4571 length:2250 start_codon:yes stop_codon:yes gene_type:complete